MSFPFCFFLSLFLCVFRSCLLFSSFLPFFLPFSLSLFCPCSFRFYFLLSFLLSRRCLLLSFFPSSAFFYSYIRFSICFVASFFRWLFVSLLRFSLLFSSSVLNSTLLLADTHEKTSPTDSTEETCLWYLTMPCQMVSLYNLASEMRGLLWIAVWEETGRKISRPV